MRQAGEHLPLGLKLAFSAWIAVWVPAYLVVYEPQNFLWLCNLANLLVLAALWTESRLLLSAQFLSVLLVGILWSLDVAGAFLTGVHLIGGTEYMFNPDIPLPARLLSLYHMLLPLVTVYGVMRLGYDRCGLWLQTAITWVVLPTSYWFTDMERNINWVHGPFGQEQNLLDSRLYVAVLMLLWPVLIYLPGHLAGTVINRLARRQTIR